MRSHCPRMHPVLVAGLHVRRPAVPIPGWTDNPVLDRLVFWTF